MLRKHGLADPSLALLARIIRASQRSSPNALGHGPRWIVHSVDTPGLRDHEILEREFIVYEALYAERGSE
jgi:hypothetical protein